MITRQPFFVPAAIFILASIPLIGGLIPRNGVYGVRTPKTLSDEGIWLRSNRFAGCLLVAANLAYLTLAALTPTADGKDFALWLTHLAAFALPLLLVLMAVRTYVRRL